MTPSDVAKGMEGKLPLALFERVHSRAALGYAYLLPIINNRFRSDQCIHLLLNFLLQIGTCPIETKQASSLDHEIVTRNARRLL